MSHMFDIYIPYTIIRRTIRICYDLYRYSNVWFLDSLQVAFTLGSKYLCMLGVENIRVFDIGVYNGIYLKISQLRQLPCLRAFHWDLTILEEIGRLSRLGVFAGAWKHKNRWLFWLLSERIHSFCFFGWDISWSNPWNQTRAKLVRLEMHVNCKPWICCKKVGPVIWSHGSGRDFPTDKWF